MKTTNDLIEDIKEVIDSLDYLLSVKEKIRINLINSNTGSYEFIIQNISNGSYNRRMNVNDEIITKLFEEELKLINEKNRNKKINHFI